MSTIDIGMGTYGGQRRVHLTLGKYRKQQQEQE